MLGVFLDAGSLDQGDLDFSALQATLPAWQIYPRCAADEVLERIAKASVIITNKVRLSEDIIAKASTLRLICVAATGVDNVDVAAASRRGVQVCNVTGYATASVVQHVFALLLSLTNHLPQYRQDLASGLWERSEHFSLFHHPVMELSGKTLGIIGYGTLGRAVAEMARHFGMQVLIAARRGQEPSDGRVSFETLLKDSDVVSLHCPLNDATRNMLAAPQFDLMPPHAILINTARGGLVHEDDLLAALKEGRIAAAGIDVLSQEPPVAGNPLLRESLPNLLVTPHIAWSSLASRQRLVNLLVDNVRAFCAGQPQNIVTQA